METIGGGLDSCPWIGGGPAKRVMRHEQKRVCDCKVYAPEIFTSLDANSIGVWCVGQKTTGGGPGYLQWVGGDHGKRESCHGKQKK